MPRMRNPGLDIPLADFDSHMALPEVGQATLLANFLSSQWAQCHAGNNARPPVLLIPEGRNQGGLPIALEFEARQDKGHRLLTLGLEIQCMRGATLVPSVRMDADTYRALMKTHNMEVVGPPLK
ncbi:MAG: hypothetical protein ABL878_06395 [Burkholderiales bacterium]